MSTLTPPFDWGISVRVKDLHEAAIVTKITDSFIDEMNRHNIEIKEVKSSQSKIKVRVDYTAHDQPGGWIGPRPKKEEEQ